VHEWSQVKCRDWVRLGAQSTQGRSVDSWALKEVVPRALASVELLTIRKFARRAQRYMDAYRKGLSQAQAEFAVRKYHSHRRIPNAVMLDLTVLVENSLVVST
jgi:hypothetical protein